MTAHQWIYAIGDKACTWSAALAEDVWPQSPCNAAETWNTGAIIVGFVAMLALFAIIRRADAWHSYYRR
jgi:hypothetical protein